MQNLEKILEEIDREIEERRKDPEMKKLLLGCHFRSHTARNNPKHANIPAVPVVGQ